MKATVPDTRHPAFRIVKYYCIKALQRGVDGVFRWPTLSLEPMAACPDFRLLGDYCRWKHTVEPLG